MAVTLEEMQDIANTVAGLSEKMKSANSLSEQAVSNNAAKQVDWVAVPAEFLDADGRLIGTNYFPADISNALGSLGSFNTDIWDAGHGGNFEKLCKPVV